MKLSILEFRDRFTLDEKRAIYSAASAVVDIKIWLDDLVSVDPLDGVETEDERTIAGVQGLEAAGLIGVGRAVEILGLTGVNGAPVGGFVLGQNIQMLPPFNAIYDSIYPITGFGPNCIEILDGIQFDISLVEAA